MAPGDNEPITRAEFYLIVSGMTRSIDTGFEGVNKRLDRIEERVGTHGEDIAVLKDRESRDNPARVTGISALIMGIVSVLWNHWSAKP